MTINTLSHGWTESRPGALASNPDSRLGGIIDNEIISKKWFVIFNDDSIPMINGLDSREKAFLAYSAAINAKQVKS